MSATLVKFLLLLLIAFISSCSSTPKFKSDPLVLTKSQGAPLFNALIRDGLQPLWEDAKVVNLDDAYSVKIPTSNPNVLVLAAIVRNELVSLAVALKTKETLVLGELYTGSITAYPLSEKPKGNPPHPLLNNALNFEAHFSQLPNTFKLIKSFHEKHVPQATLPPLSSSISPLSCSYTDAPMYPALVATSQRLADARERLEDALQELRNAEAAAALTCALCPDTGVTCYACGAAMLTIAERAITVYRLSKRVDELSEQVRALARAVAEWVEEHCQ